MTEWLKQEKYVLERIPDDNPDSKTRVFPTSGGILKSMDCYSSEYSYLHVDGQENCIKAIQEVIEGKLTKCFIEMSACAGSCVGGPGMDKDHRSVVQNTITVDHYAGHKDFRVASRQSKRS
jgi:iron only hydrogenase large subunit-like protein